MLISSSFYLESCIWPDVISQWIRQRNSIKFCANLRKVQHRLWEWLDKCLNWMLCSGETGEEQSQEHAHNFLWHQKEFVLAAQTVNSCILLWRFMVTAWKCDKTLHRTLVTKELAVASQHTVSQLLHQGIFDQHDYCPPPTLLSLFPQFIKAELQVVLNTHRTWLPGCILKMALALGTVHMWGSGLLQGQWWSVDPKFSFSPIGGSSPGNYGWL
jgi:hypothetical protein